jgi:hypothetical protein
MPTFQPPDDPEKQDAPRLSFDRAIAEEIIRSVLAATCRDHRPDSDETRRSIAAGVKMLEACQATDRPWRTPNEQIEALHAAIMDNLARAMDPRMPLNSVLQLRGGAARMGRDFSKLTFEINRAPEYSGT